MSLYDPNEFPVETNTDFSLEDVLVWARSKPADEEYDFINAGVCALGQYARERLGYSADDAECGGYEELVPRAMMRAANVGEWTFGAFASRLEQALSEGRGGL